MKGFKTESKRLLDLMINSIYTNHEVFLRELVSNASDALDKVRLARGEGAADAAGELGIHISFDQAARTLTVSDNGVGMDEAALEECLGTIAHSGSLQVKRGLAKGADKDVDIIGQFGVGFYSSFMVADHVRVVSRAMGAERAFSWESDGVDGYTVSPAERDGRGTDVILHIRTSTSDENLERYLDQSSIQYLVKRYSNYIRYPITMDLARESFDEQTGNLVRDESVVTREVVNSMTPIWTLGEDEVSQEEVDEFYRFEFRDAEAPLRTIRCRARGAIEYDAMLFVPSTADPELYTKDHRYGLKLYSSGVLIDETCESLLPSHFRFVRGIVDTKNINLNVSRESIQEDGRIQIIARQIERCILDNLKAMVNDDRPGYEKLFEAFGTGMRFAICQSQGMLTNVLNDLLLYHSAREGRLVSLQEYLDATENDKHTEVYYAVGNDIERMRRSPAVTAVLDHGKDVILCPHGAQDEFCLMVMGTFKGAAFHSVASANLDMPGDEGPRDEEDALVQETLEAILEHSPQPLVRVALSKNLRKADQPVSRISTEGLMTISMAKFVMSKLDKNEVPKPLYVLEVNPAAAVFELAKGAVAKKDMEALKRCATVMLGQAFLVEDVPLPDPIAFNEAVNGLLGLAVS